MEMLRGAVIEHLRREGVLGVYNVEISTPDILLVGGGEGAKYNHTINVSFRDTIDVEWKTDTTCPYPIRCHWAEMFNNYKILIYEIDDDFKLFVLLKDGKVYCKRELCGGSIQDAKQHALNYYRELEE